MPSEPFLEPLEVIRRLQAKNGTVIRRPQPGDRIGFAFSSKDRYIFTRQALQALDAEGSFDIVWNDGSSEPAVPALSNNWQFQHARLVEFNSPIRGGPDISICFGLKRLLDLGYDYIGLIENDVVLKPGWFSSIMNLFHIAADEGIVCGAASVRGYTSRVLEYRNGYTIDWASGAGMLLLSRPAAQLLFDNYLRPVMTTHSMAEFYAEHFGIQLECSEWGAWRQERPSPMSLDWGYTPFLYSHGYASLNTIPTLAKDLQFDVRTFLHTEYVDAGKNNAGLAHPRLSLSLPPGSPKEHCEPSGTNNSAESESHAVQVGVQVGVGVADKHQMGLKALKEGAHRRASFLLQEALKEQESAERWNDWASAQLALGHNGPAEQSYRRALDLDPQLLAAATNLGLMLASSGRHADAIPFLERCQSNLDAPARQRIGQVLADCRRVALPSSPVSVQADPPLFPDDRITMQEVANAIQVARSMFPQRKIVVLHDGVVAATDPCPRIDCRRLSLDKFSELDFANSVFVYACTWHFHGAPFIQCIISKGGRFIPVWNSGPAIYVDQNPVARRVLEVEWITQRREGYAKWDSGPGDFINLCQALEITRGKKGAFLEIGCFRGSSGSVALRYMKEAGIYRDAYFFDVFDGFKYDAALSSSDAIWMDSHATEGPALVSERLKRHEQAELGLNVIVRRHNIVEEDIPGDLPAIAIANIDVDLYEAVLAALNKVSQRMAPGGLIVVEDPGHTPQLVGARVALDEFLASKAASDFMPIYMESGQTFLINNHAC